MDQSTIWLPEETLGPRGSNGPLFDQVFWGSITRQAWEEAARTLNQPWHWEEDSQGQDLQLNLQVVTAQGEEGRHLQGSLGTQATDGGVFLGNPWRSLSRHVLGPSERKVYDKGISMRKRNSEVTGSCGGVVMGKRQSSWEPGPSCLHPAC